MPTDEASNSSFTPALTRLASGRLAVIPADAKPTQAEVAPAPIPVEARLCFPWSAPNRFVSLRDDEGSEVAFVENPGALDEDSRSALSQALSETRFTLKINAIVSIERDFELRVWKVETDAGARTFQTKIDDFPLPLQDGSYLIKDLAGDLFWVEDPEKLPRQSRELLWAYVA
jgi:hypothetical protein